MEIEVRREKSSQHATLGELFVDGTLDCHTLEDVIRERPGVPVKDWKVAAETAIPAGRYKVILTYSTRFAQITPLLLQVPGFSGIRIHPGNTDKNTEGCILVGNRITTDTVVESRLAYKKLLREIEDAIKSGEEVWITLINPESVWPFPAKS